jgi:hypothetical protein
LQNVAIEKQYYVEIYMSWHVKFKYSNPKIITLLVYMTHSFPSVSFKTCYSSMVSYTSNKSAN